eukprot:CAMPEP_0201490024 /NCGR_PEP_ID=MMETSP0151_2-20130828/24696_1 /ASSEMBLY_ACC=CAM_ASM_000257 /TAXON_ID=200890 /ORGANISM="Paramoeba atlantica, Strain 621/1 / CCAP 1560/9" /LENGTH=698 /DNA_ID=CAMNT_0047875811 /DNA_START=107 /DNA_END=2203 /DNA_ORIENTATION=+
MTRLSGFVLFVFLVGLSQNFVVGDSGGNNCLDAPLSCPSDGICRPDDDVCFESNGTNYCASYGKYLTCANGGVVTHECGSAKSDDCKHASPCSKGTYEAIFCDYPPLEPTVGYTTTGWNCGASGSRISCQDHGGGALIGVCGSGKNQDCKGTCKGYHAVECADNGDQINWQGCKWESGANGDWVECPVGFVGAGHCGSGKHDDCGGNGVWHELLCCPYIYPDNRKWGADLEIDCDLFETGQAAVNSTIVDSIVYAVNNAPPPSGNHFHVKDVSMTSLTFGDAQIFPYPGGIAYALSVTSLELTYNVIVRFLQSCTFNINIQNNQPLTIVVPFILDLGQETPSFTTSPYWVTGMNGITVTQTCLSTACWLDTVCQLSKSDVYDDSYNSFKEVWMAIPTVIGDTLDLAVKKSGFLDVPLVESILSTNSQTIKLDLRGALTTSSNQTCNAMETPLVQFLGGFYVSKDNGEDLISPFVPTVQPDSRDTQDQLVLYATDYFFHTLIWSLETAGFFDVALLPQDVPSSSPFQLNTGNPIMRTIAPGVGKYGNTPMIANMSVSPYANSSSLKISSSGVQSKNNTFVTSYYTYNETTGVSGDLLFILEQEISFTFNLSLADGTPTVTMLVDMTRLRADSTKCPYSSVGRVNTIVASTYTNSGLVIISNMLLSEPFSVPLPIPSSVYSSPPELVLSEDYIYIEGNVV